MAGSGYVFEGIFSGLPMIFQSLQQIVESFGEINRSVAKRTKSWAVQYNDPTIRTAAAVVPASHRALWSNATL
jgi:hypothetical protein